jgi:preprotein translocase subunit SecA
VADALAVYEAKCLAFPEGLETAKTFERDVILQVVDTRWREHLSDMDYLKEGIYLRQVAQIDPLAAWQKEGFQLFSQMLDLVNRDYVRFVTHVELAPAPVNDEASPFAAAVTNAQTVENEIAPAPTAGPNTKLGRNEPCWCGSGKKFKQCHGRP